MTDILAIILGICLGGLIVYALEKLLGKRLRKVLSGTEMFIISMCIIIVIVLCVIRYIITHT